MVKKFLCMLFCLTAFLCFTKDGDAFQESYYVVIRTSEVSTVVTDNIDGTYTYNYTVKNTSPTPQFILGAEVWPLIVDFEVPLFSPSDVWGIQSPEYWRYEFLSADGYIERFGEANPYGAPWILHWLDAFLPATKAIAPTGYKSGGGVLDVYENSTNGFIFTSHRSPVDGPYLTSWMDEFRNIGDPPLPGGTVGGGGTPSFNSPVPEPVTILLLGTGILGLAFVRRRMN